MPRYAIVEAPSALGHVAEHLGVERAPEVLLGARLADGLAARRAGRIEAAGYSADRDSGTHVMNPQAIRDYSPLLADAVTVVLGEGEFPVVLVGRLLDPARHDAGVQAARPLRAAVHRWRRRLLPAGGQSAQRRGVGERSCVRDRLRPDVVTDIESRRPLVRADDVVVFACRDAADRERRGCQPLPAGLLVIDRDRVRRLGAGAAAREAVRYLTRD